MATNALALARATHPCLSRFINISRQNVFFHSSIVPTPFKGTSSGFSLLQQCSFIKPTQKSTTFSELNFPKTRFGKIGSAGFSVSAAGDGGSGGTSGNGNSGGGGGGGDGKGNGGKNWSLLAWYLKMLDMYPVLTKAVTSAFLTLFGDVVCQLVIDQAPSLDLKRTFLFTFLGMVLVGPTLHFWYLYLSKLVTLPGASGAFLRLVLDQFVFSPIFIGVFLATLVTLEGRPSEVMPKLEQEWFSAVLANWQLWIPFQFLNFRFVPQQFQVLAANVVALVWNVILSFKAHKEIIRKKPEV